MNEVGTLYLYLFISFLVVFFTSLIPNRLFTANITPKRNSSLVYWIFAFFPILIYTIFWGLRDGVGTDYNSYVLFFNEAETRLYISTEYAFIYLCILLKNIGFDAISLFVVTSLINITTIFIVAQHSNKRILASLVCFYILVSCLYSLNGVRSAMAYSIFMIALFKLSAKETKWISFALISLLAFYIHHTALLLVILILFLKLFRKIEVNMFLLSIIYVGCELLGFRLQNFFFTATLGLTSLLGYGDQISFVEIAKEGDMGFMVLLRMMLSFITFYAYSKYYAKCHDKDITYYSFFIFFIGLLLSRIFVGSMLLMRVAKVFSYLGFIIVAFSFTSLVSNKSFKDKLLGYFLLVGHVVTFSIHILGNSNGVTPYLMHTGVIF